MDLDFSVDEILATAIRGWAWCPSDPELPVSIEILGEDGQPRAHVLADGFREDLALVGKRRGWCAFDLPIDADWPTGTYTIRAAAGASSLDLGQSIEHSGACVDANTDEVSRPVDISLRTPLSGYCDGIRNGFIGGWAWRPDQPDQMIHVEVSIDGIVIGSVDAHEYRPDLRVAGIGHGRYAWKLPFPRIPPHQTVQVVVREQGGASLTNGVFTYPDRPTEADFENPEFRAFVEAAFASEPVPQTGARDAKAEITNFLVYAPIASEDATLGVVDRSDGFAKAFRPLLETLGRVHMVVDPFGWHVDALFDQALARGEACLLLSFAPPHQTPLGLRCPVVPMIAWEFPTIPDRDLNDEPRHDWHHVLRQTGRAITHCQWAASAIRAAVGAHYPVAVVPVPVWDRTPSANPIPPLPAHGELTIEGLVLDTGAYCFPPYDQLPPPPAPGTSADTIVTQISGIVFTTVVAAAEGRRNWQDILSAFTDAHRTHADATLIIKMIGADPGVWWWDLHEAVARQASFACRLVVLHGDMEDARYQRLIAASHWIVNASSAEGQCLPLLEFMCAGRPAIAPSHSAMADYIQASNAIVVAATEEYCSWPNDPAHELTTARHRVDWSSLRSAFVRAYQESASDPAAYQARANAARETMAHYCSDTVISAQLDAFLGLGLGLMAKPASPSSLLRDVQAA